LSDFFQGSVPITPEQINYHFRVRVICHHNENDFYATGGDLINGQSNFTMGELPGSIV
jgi:hypothetical protein